MVEFFLVRCFKHSKFFFSNFEKILKMKYCIPKIKKKKLNIAIELSKEKRFLRDVINYV